MAAQTCSRFSRDGVPCANPTRYADGWCRSCDGFPRPRPGKGRGWTMAGARRIALDRLDIDISDVSVSRTAIENFTWHHGGDPTAAESQIRSMLEDMLVGAGKAFRRTNGEIMLVAKGSFLLVVSPGGEVVRSYRTKHRDRTWAQVKAGVRSRVARSTVRSTVRDEPAE